MALKFANTNKQIGDKDKDGIHIEQFYILNYRCLKEKACPHSTPLCQKYCFGNCVFRHSDTPGKLKLSTEIQAEENYNISKSNDFVNEMDNLIKSKKGNTELYVRIHSIGEFYSYDYFLKWINIIALHDDVKFTAYVKSFDILDQFIRSKGTIPQNLNILLSIFPDTYSTYSINKIIWPKDKTKALIDDLQAQYKAIKYIVCGKEYFIDLLKKRITYHKEHPQQSKDILFCGAGTKLLKDESSKKIIESAEKLGLINRDAYCSKCKMCYVTSNGVKEIYALLRASSQLANLKEYINNPDFEYIDV